MDSPMRVRHIMGIIVRNVICIFYALVGLSTMDLAAMNNRHVVTDGAPDEAEYKITFIRQVPLRLHISADIPIDGKLLQMDDTYPAELTEMASGGWPALISNLRVNDSTGKEIQVTELGSHGWQLSDSIRSRLKMSYEVDYSLFAAHKWSSPLESAYADDSTIAIVGRSVFITTPQTAASSVEIATHKDWLPIVPWMAEESDPNSYHVRSREDLINNMLVVSRNRPDVVTASSFTLQIVSMGHWRPLQSLLRHVLETIIHQEVSLMRFDEKEIFNVVLLPIKDNGGNAFRQGFAYCYSNPSPENRETWGNTLAHEIFHYWNYARLKGADYAGSQWFQEGFTEYVANLVMVRGKIVNSDTFIRKLSAHVINYQELTTTLENYGTHKGPPLYSAGALVAFMWDVMILHASGGSRNIGDFFRNLMVQTDSGARRYSWKDIKASLEATAEGDWEDFYQSYVSGHKSLPLKAIFPMAGLRLSTSTDGSGQVEYDPAASDEARNVWHTLIGD